MDTGSALRDRVLAAIRQHDLVPSSARVVVAVSGGADSLALLHLLHSLRDRLECHLHVATLDHGLRGAEGAADCDFVVTLARQWGLDATAGKADVPALQREQSIGLESAARLARYQFLAQVAHDVGATRIALGHHLLDQAETILLHLVRGAGLRGLRGMLPCAPHPYDPVLTLIRPLLEVTHDELERYCRDQHLTPQVDVTNADASLTRNRLRSEILPLLRQLNPQVDLALVRHGEVAAADESFLVGQLEHESSSANLRIEPGRVGVLRSQLLSWHPALQRRYVIWALERLGAFNLVTADHVRAALQIVSRGRQNAVAQFGQGFQLRLEYDYVLIEQPGLVALPDTFLLNQSGPVQVNIPGVTDLGGWKLHASLEPGGDHQAIVAIPVGATAFLRTRMPGDRFSPPGLGGHSQKLKDWLINHKVPRALRDHIPLLVINGQIAAILIREEWFVSHSAGAHDRQSRAIYLSCKR